MNTYKSRESDGLAEPSSLPSDPHTCIRRFVSSKRTTAINYGTKYGKEGMSYTIPRDYRRRSCVLSPSGRAQ